MAGRLETAGTPASTVPAKPPGIIPWLGWGCLILALGMAVIPLPVLLLWVVPGTAAGACAVVALMRNAPIHGALLLTGSLVALPLAWGLGMLGMIRAADYLIGGA